MALENLISITIPAEVKQQVIESINNIAQQLAPFMYSLSDEQRKSMPKISDGTEPYMSKVDAYTVSNPEFAPSFMDVAEFKKDFAAYADCLEMITPVKQLLAKLEDTKTLCGSEGYSQSLLYYSSVREAAKKGIGDSKVIYDDLKKRFPNNPHKNDTPAEG